jgi:hypothetical protein
MTRDLKTSLERLTLYVERVRRDLAGADRPSALANLAEVAEIARRLWNRLAQDGELMRRMRITCHRNART